MTLTVPTHSEADTFKRQFARLTREQKARFLDALDEFVDDLRRKEQDSGAVFRAGLRVKPYRGGVSGVLEMTWNGDGRALFRFGEPRVDGRLHVDWLEVGTHEIF